MGFAKEEMIESEDRGYHLLDGVVCRACLKDPELVNLFLESPELAEDCSYCEDRGRVIPVALVQTRIMDVIFQDYELAQHADLPWDGREGGWQAPTYEADDIIQNEIYGTVPDRMVENIVNAVTDTCWVERDWELLHPYDLLKHGWSAFCHTVMHQQRFTFAFVEEEDPGHPDSTSPAKTLQALGGLIQRYGLLRQVPIGEVFFRVRPDAGGNRFSDFNELASPPYMRAAANRMSPAGIPMFYGSPDLDTAIAETWDGVSATTISIGRFVLIRPVWIVDLRTLPSLPSRFSTADRGMRAAIRFLHDLVTDMSKPISRDGREHVEYAPTQIVSEYLLQAHVFFDPLSKDPIHIDGIRFPSSKTGNDNVVLNVKHEAHDEGVKASLVVALDAVMHRVLSPR